MTYSYGNVLEIDQLLFSGPMAEWKKTGKFMHEERSGVD